MKPWLGKGLDLLASSLEPPKHEPNEIDWKVALSNDTKRLAEHLCAFANYPAGGFLAFGIGSDASIQGLTKDEVEKISSRIASIGRDGVEPPLPSD